MTASHISWNHNSASPPEGCSHSQRTLPTFCEPHCTFPQVETSKAALLHFQRLQGRSTDSSRWVTSPNKFQGGVGWPWHGWTNKGFPCLPLSLWAKKILVERAEGHFHKGLWGLERCFLSGVEKEPNFSNASPNCFLLFLLSLLPLKHLVSDWEGCEFSFRFFSAYKLTPENRNTFPWKCY